MCTWPVVEAVPTPKTVYIWSHVSKADCNMWERPVTPSWSDLHSTGITSTPKRITMFLSLPTLLEKCEGHSGPRHRGGDLKGCGLTHWTPFTPEAWMRSSIHFTFIYIAPIPNKCHVKALYNKSHFNIIIQTFQSVKGFLCKESQQIVLSHWREVVSWSCRLQP